jgi:16S rRNA (adenine1518-N6/adenine1519-N6)-dimethyltransferase
MRTVPVAEGVHLLGPREVRSIAARLGLRPTKTLGQNFVVDPNTVRRIVRVAGLGADDIVLEIGPGLGSLTLGLLEVSARVVAAEVDPVLAAALPVTVRERASAHADRLEVLTADALTLSSVPGTAPGVLVANLPYNVAVPVLLHLLALLPSLSRGLVMVQSEVADRLVSSPGSRTYGVPSIKTAWYAEVRPAGQVPRSVFWPVPNVDSALVALRRRPTLATTASRAEVFAVVDAAFGQRRKTLRAALAGWAGGPAAAERVLHAAGIDPRLRGEALPVAAFARIAEQAPHSIEE